MNWSEEQLAEVLASNPGLRVELPDGSQQPRKRGVDIAPETPGDWLQALMACPSFAGRLSPEEEVSHWCAAELRKLSRARRLRCVWFRVPNEHPAGGRLGAMHQAKSIACGVVPGVPDFAFIRKGFAGLIELKVEQAQTSLVAPGGKAGVRKGRLTYMRPVQRLFARWCEECGVAHAVCRRWGEMEAQLREWECLV